MKRGTKQHRRTTWGTLALVLAMLITAGLFGLGGCSQNAINSTNAFDADGGIDDLILTDLITDDVTDEAGQTYAKSLPNQRMQEPVVVTDVESATYNPEGFAIVLDMAGVGAALEFPEDAVSERTASLLGDQQLVTIEGTHVTLGGMETMTLECGPDGLVFNSAVKLTVDVSKPDGQMCGLYYWDPVTGWQLVEVAVVTNGQVVFSVWHFSKYGIS